MLSTLYTIYKYTTILYYSYFVYTNYKQITETKEKYNRRFRGG
jgi:hypothetical protein